MPYLNQEHIVYTSFSVRMKNDLYFSSFQDATCKDVPVVKMSKSLGNQGNTNRKLNRVAEVIKK